MTNVHMRIAFMRGAARQYSGTFMSYMSELHEFCVTHLNTRRKTPPAAAEVDI